MFPTQHAALTAITALPLRARGASWGDLALFLGGAVLIDVDHYLTYAWRSGDFSLLNAYRYHKNRVPRREARLGWNFHFPPLLPGQNRPFHALLVLGVACGVALALPRLRPVVAGMLYHRLQDYVYESARVGVERDE